MLLKLKIKRIQPSKTLSIDLRRNLTKMQEWKELNDKFYTSEVSNLFLQRWIKLQDATETHTESAVKTWHIKADNQSKSNYRQEIRQMQQENVVNGKNKKQCPFPSKVERGLAVGDQQYWCDTALWVDWQYHVGAVPPLLILLCLPPPLLILLVFCNLLLSMFSLCLVFMGCFFSFLFRWLEIEL